MSDNPLAALAMRQRAAAMIETHVVETQFDGSRVVVPSPIAREDQHNRSLSKSIRALSTTFTNAELLAAAMQLPEVRALVEAATISLAFEDWNLDADPYDGECPPQFIGCMTELRAALAPFKKGAP